MAAYSTRMRPDFTSGRVDTPDVANVLLDFADRQAKQEALGIDRIMQQAKLEEDRKRYETELGFKQRAEDRLLKEQAASDQYYKSLLSGPQSVGGALNTQSFMNEATKYDMTPEEIAKVEKMVNDKIAEDIAVNTEIMSVDEAKKTGAMALFGEKYSDKVRVVSIHPYSMELCGGTHLSKTGETGLFTIVSEGAVASGVRRIEALTGTNAIEYMQKLEDTVNQLNRMLKGSDVIGRVENLSSTVRELRKENEELKNKLSAHKLDNVLNTFEQYKNIKVVSAVIENADMQVLRNLSDKARERYDDCVCVFVSTGEKVSMVIAATKKAVTSGVNAGTVIKEAAALIGGSGGGRPDMAQAGGKDSDKAHDAVQKAVQLIKEAI